MESTLINYIGNVSSGKTTLRKALGKLDLKIMSNELNDVSSINTNVVNKNIFIFVLNATSLMSNDEDKLINNVSKFIAANSIKNDKFFFVINKLDLFKPKEDSVKETIERVRLYLKDYGIENPNIYPASSLTALNIRTILSENDDDDDDDVVEAKVKVRKFNRNAEFHFEKYTPLTPSVRGEVEEKLSKAISEGDVNEQALIHSGIVSLKIAIETAKYL